MLLRAELDDVPFNRGRHTPLRTYSGGLPLRVWRADSEEEVGRCVVRVSRAFETYRLQLRGKDTARHVRVQVVDRTRRLKPSEAVDTDV